MPKLLREFETLKYDAGLIKESIKQGKPVRLSGVFQRADALNQNKRIYPKNILEREVNNYMKLVEGNHGLGELDHPDDSVVNLSNVSHVVREIGWDGDNVVGTIELLTTPKGQIARQLAECGVVFGISSRAVGETRKNSEGHDVVDESLQLVAFDLVSHPSTDGAWLNLKEARDLSLSEAPRRYRINRLLDAILVK